MAVFGRRDPLVTQQRHRPVLDFELAQLVQHGRSFLEDLASIALLELIPAQTFAVGVQQLAARRRVLEPDVDPVFADAPRPLPHDEHPQPFVAAIWTRRRVINTANPEHLFTESIAAAVQINERYSPSLDAQTSQKKVHSFAKRLWQANADLAEACLQHPFVRGLADGSLPPACFRAYVAQDAYFLEAFARAYALALARTPDRHGLTAFHTLIGGVLDELKLHATYAARWEVDLAATRPAPATLAYTDFLLATGGLGTPGDICAAMTPCMRLYAYLGQALASSGADSAYHEWIETYASDEFESLAATLEALLDRYATDCASVRAAYRRAMQLELAFFEAHAPR
jgi:thiaminase (transcriptional activator TenA)